jgi:hypothetical protein
MTDDGSPYVPAPPMTMGELRERVERSREQRKRDARAAEKRARRTGIEKRGQLIRQFGSYGAIPAVAWETRAWA